MIHMLSLTIAAQHDVEMIRAWYLQISPQLALDFEEDLEASFARIAESPESYPLFHSGHRRMVMHHFKYLVFFRVEGNKVVISLVTHQKRNPEHWQERLR